MHRDVHDRFLKRDPQAVMHRARHRQKLVVEPRMQALEIVGAGAVDAKQGFQPDVAVTAAIAAASS